MRLLRGLLAARGRPAAAVLTALLALLLLGMESRPELALRHGLFDAWQRQSPRPPGEAGTVIIAIDEDSLAALGQWPWPRTRVAQLLWQIAMQRPAAVAIDILFAEPDRLSPRRLAQQMPELELSSAAVQRLPDSDEEMAQALRQLPAVLGVGATGEAAAAPTRAPGLDRWLPRFAGSVRSTPLLDRAARGHGIFNRLGDAGLVRRLPTLATIGDTRLPGLAVETLRLALAAPSLRVRHGGAGLEQIELGGYRIPVDRDGSWWLHYSDWTRRPHLSAVEVLRGQLPAGLLEGRIVLLGYTALGLQDVAMTPLGPMPGIEVHAEAIDNLIDGRLLSRPLWAPWLEAGLLVLLGALAIALVPRLPPAASVGVYAVLALVALAAASLGFRWAGWLVDVASPLVAAGAVFAFIAAIALGEAQAQRRRLGDALVATREAQARLEGELDAARRIQIGMLPLPRSVLGDETRVEIAARMQPARTVGGDLYDFFLLDPQRLLFLIGDVSGKGLPASLFMALSKALVKGVALHAEPDPGQVLSEAALALADDNPEQLFVTMLAGVLDLASGKLLWSSAGHDAPYLMPADGGPPRRLIGRGGPPLCVLHGFRYPLERLQLRPGDRLCLITDGVTEAQNLRGEFYGSARLLEALTETTAATDLELQAEALLQDLAAFSGPAEPADDAALLLLRWQP